MRCLILMTRHRLLNKKQGKKPARKAGFLSAVDRNRVGKMIKQRERLVVIRSASAASMAI